jgi:hypothetical protein
MSMAHVGQHLLLALPSERVECRPDDPRLLPHTLSHSNLLPFLPHMYVCTTLHVRTLVLLSGAN